MPAITLFTCPKSFADEHIGLIQGNAIRSWLQLGSAVEVLLVGDDAGVAGFAQEIGARNLPGVVRNREGTPLVSSIFELGIGESVSPILGYVNADIILMPEFSSVVETLAAQLERFLIVGQRWDLAIDHALDFSTGWDSELRVLLQERGRLHPPAGSDYFVFPRTLQLDPPDFALGRAGWDNWMIFAARKARVPVVDATQTVTIVHQDHRYDHLPGGQPHHSLPESHKNLALAGGAEAMFTLRDSTHRLGENGLGPIRPWEMGFPRWLEATVMTRLSPGPLARSLRMLMHPVDSFTYFKGRIRGVLGSGEPMPG